MQWTQTRHADGVYHTFLRFKCNQCGTTQEFVPPGESEPALPEGWRLGRHEGWHVCPDCGTARKKTLLPVVH